MFRQIVYVLKMSVVLTRSDFSIGSQSELGWFTGLVSEIEREPP